MDQFESNVLDLDELPKLMKKMNEIPACSRRFKAFGSNSSFDMSIVMRAHEPTFDNSSKSDKAIQKRMAEQASKIMNHLSLNGGITNITESHIAEKASAVREKIESLVSKAQREYITGANKKHRNVDKLHDQSGEQFCHILST